MNDQFEFEDLDITLDEDLEEILKLTSACYEKFPCISVGNETLYFNYAAKSLVPDYVRWYSTSTLIIGLPADKKDKNAFLVNKAKFKHSGACTRHPSVMQQKKIARGTYKLYKYKDGFAFKRYEPLINRS